MRSTNQQEIVWASNIVYISVAQKTGRFDISQHMINARLE